MMDYYISAADEPTMLAVLIEAGVTDDEGNPTPGHAVSVIGTWHEQLDPEAEPVEVPGWHVNVRSSELIQWPESVTVAQPKTPWRIFG